VIDASSIDFYWEKYSKKEYRWFDYTKNKKLEEITFRDWMVLVSDPSYLLGDEFVLD
jgi:hypothetical protein